MSDAYRASQTRAAAELATELDRKELQQQLAVLTARLDRGLAKIEGTRAKGVDVAGWEALWLALEGEYRASYDRLHGPA